jgi:hypothetical protein
MRRGAATMSVVALPHASYPSAIEVDVEDPRDQVETDQFRPLCVLVSVEIRESARTGLARLSYQATLRLNPFDAQTLASAILAQASEALARSGM